MKRASVVSAWIACLFAIACFSSAATTAFAQGGASFPTKPVKIIVPFAAGSNSDIFARIIADGLGAMWKQPVIVENKPGLSGTVSAANSAPDGYTLLLTSNGHTIISVINKGLTIDPVNDFAGVTQIASQGLVLVVPPSLPVKTLKELIALAKKNPGKLNFASAGLASANYIAGEMFKQMAKIDIVHVPYRGSQEQYTAIMRGDAQIDFAGVGAALGLIQSNRMHALALAAPRRSAALPDVPTFAEAGMPEFNYDSWYGILAPAHTAAPILQKVSHDIASVLRMPEVQKRWKSMDAVPVTNSPAAFDAVLRADTDRYGKLLKAAGVSAQ